MGTCDAYLAYAAMQSATPPVAVPPREQRFAIAT